MYWTKSKWIHIACVILVAILGIKLLYPLEQYMDILFGDEATYMYIADNFFKIIDLSFGPLYSLYYKTLFLISDDKIYIYYLNFKILSVVLPVLLYVLLIRLKFLWQTSLFIALSFLISTVNITCWPKISHFTIIIILCFLIASTYLKNTTKKIILFTIGTFIIAYTRPEFFLLFYLLVIISIVMLLKYRTKNNVLCFLGATIIVVLILSFIGYPSSVYYYPNNIVVKRSFVAVVQHYFLSEQMRGIKHDFYLLSAFDYYYNGIFKDTNGSILKLFTQHFPLMLKHVLVNVGFYIIQFVSKLASLVNPFFIKIGKKFILSSLIIFTGLIISLYKNKQFKTWFKSFYSTSKIELIFIVLFLTPTLISCLLIMPREHYLVLQILFIAIIAALFIQSVFVKSKYLLYIGILIIVFISFTRTLKQYTFIQVDANQKNVSVNLIKDLQEISKTKDSLFIFSDLLNSSVFIDNADEADLVEYSFYYHQFKDFADYMTHKPYNIIVYSKALEQEPLLKNDTSWHAFLNNPELLNFKEYKYKNIGDAYSVFIKDK